MPIVGNLLAVGIDTFYGVRPYRVAQKLGTIYDVRTKRLSKAENRYLRLHSQCWSLRRGE